jgi:hypothetical protein
VKDDFDPELEAAASEELEKLPLLSAPRTLIPRVLAMIEASAGLPWWQRTWWDWPLAAKATFLLLALAGVGWLSGSGVLLGDAGAQYSDSVTRRLDLFSSVWNLGPIFVSVAQVLWLKLAQPYVLYLIALALTAYLVCIGAGTLFVRVATQRINPPAE